MTTTKKTNQISLIGLGQMGKKLAQLYVNAGFEVNVWNRSPNKALSVNKVQIAPSARDAIKNSTITLICVYDNNATLEILTNLPDPSILANKTIINLTTGDPQEASQIESIIVKQGGSYLNGAIQVAPDQMGLESTTILLSGSQKAYLEHKYSLAVLGGNLKYLSEDASASSAIDLATLTWLYGSYIGLMYAVKLCQQYHLELEDFSQIMGEVTPGYTAFFQHEIAVIKQGDFQVTQSPLSISVAATQRIADSFKNLNVVQEFPAIIAKIVAEASRKGLANLELAALIKIIDQSPDH